MENKNDSQDNSFIDLSVCTITTEGELESLKELQKTIPAGAEWIIVITRPSDSKSLGQTVEIENRIDSNGIHIKLFEYQFQDRLEINGLNSFSDARNIAIQQASRNWCFMIDSDERIVATDGELERIINSKNIIAALVAVHSWKAPNQQLNSKPAVESFPVARLFKKIDGVEYSGRIHEQVTPTLEQLAKKHGLSFTYSPIMVYHVGYWNNDNKTLISKHTRNKRLMILDLADMIRAKKEDDSYYKLKENQLFQSLNTLDKLDFYKNSADAYVN